jgi:hypothetical protein
LNSAKDLSLEKRCEATIGFYSAIEATTYVALQRFVGAEALDRMIAKLLGDHMAAHFVEGLAKLGIEPGTSDAVQCALYHVLSNELGGYKVGFVKESDDKAWIFYDTPYTAAHPWMGLAYAGFRPSYWIEQMLNWHACDGEAIGNPGVAFVSTHFVALGDPYDAGYFIDTHRELAQAERLQFRLGETPPADIPISYPLNDLELWPHERRVKAHRNYARDYAGAVLAAVVRTVGREDAAKIVEYVIRTVLFAQRDELRAAVDASSNLSAVGRVAATIAYLEDIAASEGQECDISVDGDEAVVQLSGKPALLASEEWTSAGEDEAALAADAVAAGWFAWAAYVSDDIAVSLDTSRNAWRIVQSDEVRSARAAKAEELRRLALDDLIRIR